MPLFGEKAPKQTSTEKQLFEAMDAAALDFVKILTSDAVDDNGKPLVSFKEKVQTFRLALEWLVKSKRIKSDDGEEELPPGIAKMRDMIAGPPPPKRKSRRATTVAGRARQVAARAAKDDSALAKAMGTK
jgi:hypothetical protein